MEPCAVICFVLIAPGQSLLSVSCYFLTGLCSLAGVALWALTMLEFSQFSKHVNEEGKKKQRIASNSNERKKGFLHSKKRNNPR